MTPYHKNVINKSRPCVGFLGEVSISCISTYLMNMSAYEGAILVPIAVPCICLYILLLNLK